MRLCSATGCSRKHYANGYCQAHDRRVKASGRPGGPVRDRARQGMPLADRLALYAQRMPNGCLEWTGYRMPDGYGQMNVAGRARLVTHVAWFVAHGEWPPEGMFLCHRCDNPPCFDVGHLFLGTLQDNVADAVRKGRMQRGEAWRRSHGFTGAQVADGRALETLERALAARQEVQG